MTDCGSDPVEEFVVYLREVYAALVEHFTPTPEECEAHFAELMSRAAELKAQGEACGE